MGEEFSQEIYVGHLLKKKAADSHSESTPAGEVGPDHQELQSIVNNLVKLPEEAPAPKPVKIARITHHEIKTMRATQSNMPAARVEQKVRASALIQTFDAFMGLFKQQEKRSRCLIDGHQCKHCGQIIKVEEAKAEPAPRGH
jgi:hypothetical protein